MTQTVGWRAIFWINIPIGLAAVVLTALYVPESRAARARRIDPVGQLLVIVALASLTYAIIEGPRAGWSSAQTHRHVRAVGRWRCRGDRCCTSRAARTR